MFYEEIESLRNQYAEGSLDVSLQDTYLKEALEHAKAHTPPAKIIELEKSNYDEAIPLSEAFEAYLGQLKGKSVRAFKQTTGIFKAMA